MKEVVHLSNIVKLQFMYKSFVSQGKVLQNGQEET